MGSGAVVAMLGRDRRAMWYSGFAVYAAGVALFSGPGLDHWWGAWAAGGYAVAAIVTVAGSGRSAPVVDAECTKLNAPSRPSTEPSKLSMAT
jgi:hypothetical protein